MSFRRALAAAATVVAVAAAPGAARAAPAAPSSVAQARRASVALYRTPGARRPFRVLGAITGSYGTRPVFLVRRDAGRWLQVYLPVRPNHSTAWIRRAGVSVAVTDYRLAIDLTAHRLVLRRGRSVVLKAPVGVGRAVAPTPVGIYYIAYAIRTSDRGGFFGPYAYGLSAYSPVYTRFAGGDGEIGLHGTNRPELLGRSVSHGCIRLANAVISRLIRLLPLGTPVAIQR